MLNKLKSLIAIPNIPASLPSELFPNEEGEYTWEDWEKENQKKYPIRWFLSRTIPSWFNKHIYGNYAPWNRFWYWFRCHTYTRYHMLDLRQPKESHDSYAWGYRDVPELMMYSCFNLLKIYIEKEEPTDPAQWWSAEEMAEDPILQRQKAQYDEAMTLYNYWTKDRKEHGDKVSQLLNEGWQYRKTNRAKYEELMDLHREEQKKFDETEENMLIRLMKIRTGLWT